MSAPLLIENTPNQSSFLKSGVTEKQSKAVAKHPERLTNGNCDTLDHKRERFILGILISHNICYV